MADDKNKNENVVIAFFSDASAADNAVASLKNWDRANDEIKLGAVGTITKEGDKVKTHVGRRAGKGMTIGAVVGAIAAVLTGGAVIGAALGYGALGGVLGAFFKKSTHLSQEEIDQIGAELDTGKVAVVVTCDAHEIHQTSQQLLDLGGTVRTYTVPAEAVEEAAPALEEAGAIPAEEGQEVVFEGGAPVTELSDDADKAAPAPAS
jgi:uncharacterized membrane protein